MAACCSCLIYVLTLGLISTSYFAIHTLSSPGSESSESNAIPEFLAFTVATNETDAYKQLRSSAELNFIKLQTLGMGRRWTGGDVLYGPGGGLKVNLLKDALESYKHMPDLIILFVDGYDTIMLSSVDNIISKFKEFDARIVFTAEPTVWPDPKLAKDYPETDSHYKYLNSGGYIGYANDLYTLLSTVSIKDSDDDQLMFTKLFLDEAIRSKHKIKLDYKAEIFQALSFAEDDVEVRWNDETGAFLYNKRHSTAPLIVQGNGKSKHLLNTLGNYLPNKWTPQAGCLTCAENKIDLSSLKPKNYPRVLLGVFIDKPTPFIEEFLAKVTALDYPPKKVSLFLYNNVSYHEEIVKSFIEKSDYLHIKTINPEDDIPYEDALSAAVEYCLQKSCDYYFMIQSEAHLDNADTLKLLIEQNKTIIAPMLVRPFKMWSNFWGAVSPAGFYARSFDYLDIIGDHRKGLWNTPYVSTAILINATLFQTKALRPIYKYQGLDPDMSFCAYYRDMYTFMYVDNQVIYGHLVSKDFFDTARTNPDFYEMRENKYDWDKRYLHEEYYENLKLGAATHQPCPDVYWFPIGSPRFCKELIEIVEAYGQWSDGSNNDSRLETGYEAVPTRDIHMNQVGLHGQWLEFLRVYVKPLQEKVFIGYHHDYPRSLMNFVVRYKPGEQPSLRPHHDSSTYTINIALNEAHKDFEGGGCHFLRYKCSVTDTRLGWMLMHPGRLTHYHEGLEVTEGTRYIMISFVDP
nr:PREDICTED: procollagen-lysine,2-oxoglutarate 5-dioxygenase 3 isoform X1 [Bemisia tabaci]